MFISQELLPDGRVSKMYGSIIGVLYCKIDYPDWYKKGMIALDELRKLNKDGE